MQYIKGGYLEDLPSGSKWFLFMLNKSPKDRVVGPLKDGRFLGL